MCLKSIEDYGWAIKENSLTILWDCDENIAAIRERIHSLLQDCKCSTGCTSRRCGCKRKGKTCSIGWQCLNCLNLDNVTALPQNEINELAQVALCEDVNAGRFGTEQNVMTLSTGYLQKKNSLVPTVTPKVNQKFLKEVEHLRTLKHTLIDVNLF